ncbi:MAG: hypothetical protein EBU46_00205 [Nitrosomonadaceae bacterium]|nr:hypothetical protein [Nitrosomonadaceae bacterium]
MILNVNAVLSLPDNDVEVEMEVAIEVFNSGIGAYEFWGQRGHDVGPETGEVSLIWLSYDEKFDNFDKQLQQLALNWLDDNYDKLQQMVYERL